MKHAIRHSIHFVEHCEADEVDVTDRVFHRAAPPERCATSSAS